CKFGPSTRRKYYLGLHRQQGVTLVELMIALAIGLLVTIAMLKVYVDSSRLYRFNEGLARVQENGRFALEFIRRDARVAGFWGCNSDAEPYNGISATSDAYIDVAAGHITGTSDDGLNSADSITFRSATGSGAPVTVNMSGTDDNITVDSPLVVGKAALISDCERSDLFQVTGNDGAVLKHGVGANALPDLKNPYAAGARVYEARETTYCIANGTGKDKDSNRIPSLRRAYGKGSASACENGDELLEGIEDMQILYGEDTDADGTANRYVAINEGELQKNRIVSVRISLLMRSINNNLTTEPSPYTFNGNTVTPGTTDKYLRKVFSTTVALRNKAIN
ncbi:MAG: PilW family protein, partial [Halioglobus sp.]|nr:PilW family protein [Halioglobus sp.]